MEIQSKKQEQEQNIPLLEKGVAARGESNSKNARGRFGLTGYVIKMFDVTEKDLS